MPPSSPNLQALLTESVSTQQALLLPVTLYQFDFHRRTSIRVCLPSRADKLCAMSQSVVRLSQSSRSAILGQRLSGKQGRGSLRVSLKEDFQV